MIVDVSLISSYYKIMNFSMDDWKYIYNVDFTFDDRGIFTTLIYVGF